VADALASRLGWDEARREAEIAHYREYLRLEAEAFSRPERSAADIAPGSAASAASNA
jgi:hypothetical protein